MTKANESSLRGDSDEWPPVVAANYVGGSGFLNAVNSLSQLHVSAAHRTDAAALVIDWFEDRAIENPSWFKRFESSAKFKAYLRRALVRAGIRAARLRAKERPLTALPVNWDPLLEVSAVIQKEEQAVVSRMIAELPIQDQELLSMLLRGHNQSQLARNFGITKQSVNARVQRILDRLRKEAKL